VSYKNLSIKDSILVVDKPKGKTSFWVVNRVKKLSGIKKVGHTGTLDPLATGVLPVCVGEATKLSDLIMSGDKVYAAKIKLGERTDTLDADGTVTQKGTRDIFSIDEQELLKVFNCFNGDVLQIPPMYSAIKKDGVPLYKLARKGETIERATREIRVEKIELLNMELPYVGIRVSCSKGTYIRTLVDDIGEKLGTFAHVVELRRERSGIFDISQSINLDENIDDKKILSIEEVVKKIIPVINVPRALALRVANGLQLSYSDLMSAAGTSKEWACSTHVALFSTLDGTATENSGEQKLVAVLKIIPQDFEELINMSSSSKIAKTVRIFQRPLWN